MKTLVVTGLSGTIGRQLLAHIPYEIQVWNLYHTTPLRHRRLKHRQRRIDLTNAEEVSRTLQFIHPDMILHMAAMTHVDVCEADKKNGRKGKVWKTNVDATVNLIEYAKRERTFFCFLSTECVFDGSKKKNKETDPRNPINWYGYTKAQAEQIVETLPTYAIIRSVVAFHDERAGQTIYGKFFTQLMQSPPLRAVNDKYFSPTYTKDIVDVILQVLQYQHAGIFHVCSPELLTPHQFARRIASRHGFDPDDVTLGVSAEKFLGKKRSSKRLQYASLSCVRTTRLLGISGSRVGPVLESFTV